MATIRISLPRVDVAPAQAPGPCPDCWRTDSIRWGTRGKPVRDPFLQTVVVHRFRCASCHVFFSHYPEGTDEHSDQTDRMRLLTQIVWCLTPSIRQAVEVLRELGCQVGRTTILKNVEQIKGPYGAYTYGSPSLKRPDFFLAADALVVAVSDEDVANWCERLIVLSENLSTEIADEPPTPLITVEIEGDAESAM